ncbi:MAG: HPF/RaiA family ribosome-associated protein [Candidatus Niyogibacteria bacterium]|nr:HPF/RaiA family ribosome-associated protein [Candidatus Niyogibacteria bacterium]
MKVRLYGKNVDITESMNALITEKLVNPVKRLLPKIDKKMDMQFDIEVRRRTVKDDDVRWLCEINIVVPGRRLPLRVVAQGPSFQGAVDAAKDMAEQRIKKFKGKQKTKTLRGARKFMSRMRPSIP